MSLDAYVKFKTAYQLSPIILTGGIATNIREGALPIINITEPYLSDLSATDSGVTGSLNGGTGQFDAFAHYQPMAGGTLVNNQVAMYPFANQAIAANAIISQPLVISMMMICPAGNAGGYGPKQTKMMTLKSSLAQHNNLGGTYSIITPSYIYTNCIMTGMRDISGGESAKWPDAADCERDGAPHDTFGDGWITGQGFSKLAMNALIGIDPGLSGALAILSADGSLELVADLPVIRDRSLAWIDGSAMQSIILGALEGRSALAMVERVSSMPRQGIASAFQFGVGFGSILGVLQALHSRIEFVTPAVWKQSLGLSKDKKASLHKARLMFPTAELHLAKHDGRAEALLIAQYACNRLRAAAA